MTARRWMVDVEWWGRHDSCCAARQRGGGSSDPDRALRPRPPEVARSFASLFRSTTWRKSVDFSRRRRRTEEEGARHSLPPSLRRLVLRRTQSSSDLVSASFLPSFLSSVGLSVGRSVRATFPLSLPSHRSTTAVFSLFFPLSFFPFRLLLLLLPLASFILVVLHYTLPASPGSLPSERTNEYKWAASGTYLRCSFGIKVIGRLSNFQPTCPPLSIQTPLSFSKQHEKISLP